jgi:hypothetical protein
MPSDKEINEAPDRIPSWSAPARPEDRRDRLEPPRYMPGEFLFTVSVPTALGEAPVKVEVAGPFVLLKIRAEGRADRAAAWTYVLWDGHKEVEVGERDLFLPDAPSEIVLKHRTSFGEALKAHLAGRGVSVRWPEA